MKRILAVVVTVALSTGIITSVGASPQKLSSELLSIDQMPTGWSIDNSSGGGGVGCLSTIMEPKGIMQTSSASVSIDDNGNPPLLAEKLVTFTNASMGYKKIVATMNACKHVSGSSGGTKVTGTIGQMSFPHYGNASTAFSVNLVVQSTNYDEVYVVVRKGNIVMGIAEADYPPVDVSQFQGFVVKALSRVK